jgi:hypothetical protein
MLVGSGETPEICNNWPELSTFLMYDFLVTLHLPLGIAKLKEMKLYLNDFGM